MLLSRAASAEVTDYRLDMALRWATVNRVSAVAAFAAEQWEPTVTAMDIAGRADIALVSIPANADLAVLVQALVREIGGGAELALGRAQQGLDAVLRAEVAGASLDRLRESVSRALGTPVEFRPRATGNGSLTLTADGNPMLAADGNGALATDGSPALVAAASSTLPGPGTALTEVTVPVLVGDTLIGQFAAPEAHGDLAVAARLVLHNAASAAGRLLDLARQARELPARSRSELLAELLMSDSAHQRGPARPGPAAGHRARRLACRGPHRGGRPGRGSGRDEVHRFELLESAGQIALQAAAAAGGTWHLSRVARAIVLIRVTALRSRARRPARAPPGRPSGRCRRSAAGCPRWRSAPGWAPRTRGRWGCALRRPRPGPRCSPPGPPASRPVWPRTTRWACSGC